MSAPRSNPSRAGALLLYVLIAVAMLWPYRSRMFRRSGDLPAVICGTVEAANALKERQFPFRVAPSQAGGARFPFFQYYGNFPFTATGAIDWLVDDPYLAWKIVTILSLAGGGYFAFRLAQWMSGQRAASVLAGAVFMTAPYMFTDINARGAFTEVVAFNLLPAVAYFSIRAFASPRPRWILACALAWTLLGLSHNVAYLYAVPFLGLWFIPRLFGGRRTLWRVGRLALAAGLHAALIAWYVAPQLRTLSILGAHLESLTSPYPNAALAPLSILFWPIRANNDAGAATPTLGLQIGWPIAISALLALVGLARPGRWRARRILTIQTLGIFALAVFASWSPLDIARYLPHVFWFVQFPYRLLMFVVLWGSSLTACALATWFSRGVPRGVFAAVLVGLGVAAGSYFPRGQALEPRDIEAWIADPSLPRPVLDFYLPAPSVLTATSWAEVDAQSLDFKAVQESVARGGIAAPASTRPALRAVNKWRVSRGGTVRLELSVDRPTVLAIPVLYYPRVLAVRDNGHAVKYGNVGRFTALSLTPGHHRISATFAGIRWANLVSVVAWGIMLLAVAIGAIARYVSRASVMPRPRPWRPTGRSPAAAVAGLAAFVCGVAIFQAHPIRRIIHPSPHLHLWASSQFGPEYGPENAFDDDPDTCWMAQDSSPAVLRIERRHPARLGGILLEPRRTALYEGYQDIRLVMFRNGKQVFARDVHIADAAHQRIQNIEFQPIKADRIDLYLSNPNTQTAAGIQVPLAAVKPGYVEIRLLWK